MNNLCRKIQSIAKLFRCLEILVATAFITWFSTRLPFAVRLSGEYFLKLSSIVFNPISIFLLGNAIVLSLLTKSGLFSSSSTTTNAAIDNAVADLYSALSDERDPPEESPKEVVFQDKEMIVCEVKEESKEAKKYERSKSEKVMVVRRESGVEGDEKEEKSEKVILRRTKTMAEDGMSNEEFQRTIEAFIAKQVMFHKQERLSVVLHGQA